MSHEIYQLRVKGYLDPQRSDWFDGLTISHNEQGESILCGSIADQAALYGVLAKIRDSGLTLLEVSCKGRIKPHDYDAS